MKQIDWLSYPQLAEAVILWTGHGRTAWPLRDESLLIQRFGPELAAQLLAMIRYLEDEFYTSEARFVAADLREMEKISAEQFEKSHLGVAEEIVKAFAWCYTFDFK
jgi:hypothetical protein